MTARTGERMTPDQAAWVREQVFAGRPWLAGPICGLGRTCMHIPQPLCGWCRHGHHDHCTGLSWGDVAVTQVRDHRGFGDRALPFGRSPRWVWLPSTPCRCRCRTKTRRPPDPTTPPAVIEQLDLFAAVA
jgi:hypothetical protein